jgi:hypothetical protein
MAAIGFVPQSALVVLTNLSRPIMLKTSGTMQPNFAPDGFGCSIDPSVER